MSTVPSGRVLVAPVRRRLATAVLAIALAVALAGLLQPARAAQPAGNAAAAVETATVASTGDAAHDAAIWVNPTVPGNSAIIGTDNKAALEVYDLTGARLRRYTPTPAPNSVDVRSGISLAGQQVDVVATVGSGIMRFYTIDATRKLTDKSAKSAGISILSDTGSHGICLYKSPDTGSAYAFVIGEGFIEQYELFESTTSAGKIDARRVRGPWDVGVVGSGAEGCVVDDELHHLYVSERSVGIWKYGAKPTDPMNSLGTVDVANPVLGKLNKVEGLALVRNYGGMGYLLASSQGSDSFNVYRREANNAFVRSFKVADGASVDGCTDTFGIDAVAANMGPAFPDGVFVCQDDDNTAPGSTGNQNFKVVPLAAVVEIPPPPPVTTTTTTAPGTGPGGTTPTTTNNQTSNPPRQSSPTGKSGYWMVGSDGKVYAFGDSKSLGNATIASGAEAVDLEPTPSGNGYWIVDSAGHVFAMGDAKYLGNVDSTKLPAGEKVTSLSSTRSGNGYWIFTSKGRVVTFGDAVHRGDMSAVRLNGPVLDSIPTASGNGYYMVASDGGIFSFGDAKFHGSMGDKKLNAPVQSLVPDGDNVGYWLVASDGGIFSFQAPFKGSMGSTRLNKPVTGMVRFGNGYLMVAEDGGIFNFSDKPFHGSLGASPPARPIVSVAALD